MNNFVKYALIRCVRTIAQTAIATIGSAVVFTDVNWPMVVSASCLAGILSLLTSVATGLPEAKYEGYLYMNVAEPDDAEVDENEIED